MSGKSVLLMILDGFGIRENTLKNAVENSHMPNLKGLFSTEFYTLINPGGEMVGLPKGVVGNSEVGHMNIGSGRAIRQDLVRINEAIDNDHFKDLSLLNEMLEYCKANSKKFHILGLFSDGGVHSHIGHLEAIHGRAKALDISIYLHAFMDGRDTPRDNGVTYIDQVKDWNRLKFASMHGRSWAMDRDRRYEKIQASYDVMIGAGDMTQLSPKDYLQKSYQSEIFDEFVNPVLFSPEYKIEEDDAVFFINFRPDRAIQLTQAFCLPNFEHFPTPVRPKKFLCMTPYIPDEMELPILFDKEEITGGLSEYLSKLGLKQFKTAETEKFAHITYFFNGGRKAPFDGEDRALIPSPKDVASYDQAPLMSAPKVANTLCEKLRENKHHFYLTNFANPDMVGHTGNYEAVVTALEYLDQRIGEIVSICQQQNISVIITSDHGNCDQMIYEDQSVHTSHSKGMSPLCVVLSSEDKKKKQWRLNQGDLALKDIAPTILTLLGLTIPDSFTGVPIIE